MEMKLAVIGGGVVGLAIARALAKEMKDDLVVLEKAPFLGEAQSGRNSGVIHSGIYYPIMSLKNTLCAEGNPLLYTYAQQKSIPFLRTGKYLIAMDQAEQELLQPYKALAQQKDIPLEELTAYELQKQEPNVRAASALYLPTTGIIDAAALIHALARDAEKDGVLIQKDAKVVSIHPMHDQFTIDIRYQDVMEESITVQYVINAAGAFADEIAQMVNNNMPYQVQPVRGEYAAFLRTKRQLDVKSCVYPVPHITKDQQGKKHIYPGLHLTPTLDEKGQLGAKMLVGPTSSPVEGKENYETGRQDISFFTEHIRGFLPAITEQDLSLDYAGIRAHVPGLDDFHIQFDAAYPNCLHLLGIESPGLTSSLAIGRYVQELASHWG